MRKSVLIIENDPDTMEVLSDVINEMNLNPVCVGEAIDLELVNSQNPNLILLDHWLDETFGADLCRQLKTSAVTRHIPIIMMSAAPGIEKIAYAAGADAFVPKPFDLEELCGTINRLIL